MTGKDILALAYRFPDTAIPKELQVGAVKVSFEKGLGWVCEYWYYTGGYSVPCFYAKLGLPEGMLLQLNRLWDKSWYGKNGPAGKPCMDLTGYLDMCAAFIANKQPDEAIQAKTVENWLEKIAEPEKIWFSPPVRVAADLNGPGRTQTALSETAAAYWTAQRVAAMDLEPFAQENQWKVPPFDKNHTIWHWGRESPAVKACIPSQLMQGLPRLSYDSKQGWLCEFWYYETGVLLPITGKPAYYIQLRYADGAVLKLEILEPKVRFSDAFQDIVLYGDREIQYIGRCENLLHGQTPTQEEIDELQGLWLEAHPPAQAAWIIENTCIGEGVFRSILDSTRPHPKEVFRLIWSREILKGVRLGTPEVAELCMAALMEYRTFRCKKTENEPHSAL